ncbi:MAG: NAD(P)/FAD-dependent oxidoreductase [Lachnospiraceae bacterium]|nr:NAD(P)/FAD-dependent oxidoreductase [Lachnospiraceae bacterium]
MRIVIVGGGAAGMMAAAAASVSDCEVILLEKNEKLGKKLFITGKGRCNLTNACDYADFFENIVTNAKFMYSSFYGFTNDDVMGFFEEKGLRLKTERGDRVFPLSDRSSDVIKTLERHLKDKHVDLRLNTSLESIDISDGKVSAVITERGERIEADRIILALGGVSYPGCGASDDTFRVAKALDIAVSKAEPSLVPFVISQDWVGELQGLSLKNVSVSLECGKRTVYKGFGEMLFTHFGVSGPLILSASSHLKENMYKDHPVLHIDLKPALTEKQLDDRLLRDFSLGLNRQFSNSLGKLLPAKLIPVIVKLSDIEGHKRVNEITRTERERLVRIIKDLKIDITGNRGFDEAIITRGGINIKEINPSTMESRKIHGLYFAGEMIDVDALTGGFNLQIAWSTGHLAGISASGSNGPKLKT